MNIRDQILPKFKYDTGNFNNVINFWKDEIGVLIHPLSEHADMLLLDEKCINKLKELDYIPCDCRIFAHSYSQIKEDGYYLILQKSGKGIDCMVPEDCYYLGLSERNNTKISGDELRSCLGGDQGYWITKIADDKYVGISSNGIITLTLDEWFKFYADLVKTKLKELTQERIDPLNIKKLQANILYSKIQLNGIDINLVEFGNCGEINVVSHYNEKMERISFI